MTLQDHLNATKETVNAFADRIGVKRSTIRKIVYRQRQPSLGLAATISAATAGEVTLEDMVITAPEAVAA